MAVETRVYDVQTWLSDTTGVEDSTRLQGEHSLTILIIISHCLYCPLQQAYLLEEGATNSLRAKQNQCKRDIPFLLYPKSPRT